MKSRIYLLALVGPALMLVGSEAWARCYVDQNAKGKNDGSTWANAYVHPQLALINSCTEIWVAKGVYTPVLLGSDPTVSFDIPAGTKMYGGFAGGESSVDQRLPSINQTVLSGDVDHNDFDPGSWMDRTTGNINGKNSHHIVTMQPTPAVPITSDTIFDGFLVVGGNVPYRDRGLALGGGLYCGSDDIGATCNPILSNMIFAGNNAYDAGGAIAFYNVAASPRIVNSNFHHNSATNEGGGIYIYSTVDFDQTLISGCVFADNSSYFAAGAVEIANGNAKVINTTFVGNIVQHGNVGAVWVGGNAPLSVINSTFVGNAASNHGGAISNEQFSTRMSGGTIFVTNSIFWASSANRTTQDIYDKDTNFSYIASSVLETGCPDASSVCLNVSTDDPKLSSPADHGGSTVTLLPGVGGSAVDTGNDGSACPPFDQRGVARPQGAHCDIGAVEWQPSDDIIFRNGFQ